MQFIQCGRTYINVSRIVRLQAENKTSTVVWLDVLNTPHTGATQAGRSHGV